MISLIIEYFSNLDGISQTYFLSVVLSLPLLINHKEWPFVLKFIIFNIIGVFLYLLFIMSFELILVISLFLTMSLGVILDEDR